MTYENPKTSKICVNIDECQHNPCGMGEHSVCTDTIGSYECSCQEGYELLNKTGKKDKGGGKCKEIKVEMDECELGQGSKNHRKIF